MYLLVVWLGVFVWCAMCSGSTSKCYAAARFLFALRVDYNLCTYRPVHVSDNV